MNRIHKLCILLILTCIIQFHLILKAQTVNPLEQSKSLFQEEKYQEAKTILLSLMKQYPIKAEVAYYLGRVYFQEDKLDSAISMFQYAKIRDKKVADYPYWLGRMCAVKMQNVSLLKKKKWLDKTKESMESAVLRDPNHVDARFMLIQLYLTLPGIFGGDKEKGKEHVDAMVTCDPHLGHLAMGIYFNVTKEYPPAEKEYLMFLEGNKNDDGTVEGQPYNQMLEGGLNMLGYGYLGDDNFEKAIEIFTINVETFPESYNAYDSLAEAYMKKGEDRLAIENYQKALDMNPRLTNGQKRLYKSGEKKLKKLNKD